MFSTKSVVLYEIDLEPAKARTADELIAKLVGRLLDVVGVVHHLQRLLRLDLGFRVWGPGLRITQNPKAAAGVGSRAQVWSSCFEVPGAGTRVQESTTSENREVAFRPTSTHSWMA